jgi:phage tail-like protein
MLATAPTGFMNLNAANQWPSFTFANISIDKHGAIELSASGSGYASAGAFMGGPFQALNGATPWYRFTIDADALPANTHLQIFSFTSASGTPPFAPSTSNPFPGWHPAPRDSFQGVLFNAPAPNLWVGGVLRGDGSATPSIRQVRIDYGRNTYLKYLPGIYRADPASSDLLDRLLSLTQTALGGLRDEIFDLPKLFDPAASPYRGYPSWFAWLSGWLAWQLNQHWTQEQARDYLAGAFQLYAQRGTVEGIRRYLKIYAGVSAHISEPALQASIWSLGANSTLGFTTMLAPASAAGAILDSTSILDAADLTGPADPYGAALFDDVAYRFSVEIYAGELSRPGAFQAARAVIAREKPAHTVCDLCIIQPRMRVGAQCRIGIDTVVAAPRQAQLGTPLDHVVLAHHDRECIQKEASHAG